jgi:hypothetical protein
LRSVGHRSNTKRQRTKTLVDYRVHVPKKLYQFDRKKCIYCTLQHLKRTRTEYSAHLVSYARIAAQFRLPRRIFKTFPTLAQQSQRPVAPSVTPTRQAQQQGQDLQLENELAARANPHLVKKVAEALATFLEPKF